MSKVIHKVSDYDNLIYPNFNCDYSWSKEEHTIFAQGGIVEKRNRRYRVCPGCLTVICVDKTFFGSWHICD